MGNFDASQLNGAPVQCIVCGKPISDGLWFGRVNLGKWRVALCCPRCTEKYAVNPRRYNWKIEAPDHVGQSGMDEIGGPTQHRLQ
jgi:hypothetical protein